MYCVKCGNNSTKGGVVCEKCGEDATFGQMDVEHVEKKKTYGMYLSVIGNVFLLLGLLCSFILIKTDAPTDYAAAVFQQKTVGPIESAQPTEETEETKTEEVKLEEKGYSYSVLEYLSRRTPGEKDSEDCTILAKVANSMKSAKVDVLDMSDEEQVEKVVAGTKLNKQQVMNVLENYSKSNMTGVVVICVAMLALALAVWRALKGDCLWSLIFSAITIVPVWNLFAKLDGITQWGFESGAYLYMIGIFMVVIGAMMSGNTDVCPECQTELPGGALYCFQCGHGMVRSRDKKCVVRAFAIQKQMLLAVIGNVLMFLPVVVPVFVMEANGRTSYMNLMQLRGLQNVSVVVAILLIAGIAALIAAVVTMVFDKRPISTGCSIGGCALFVLAIYLVQKVADVNAMFLVVMIPVGLFLSLVPWLDVKEE